MAESEVRDWVLVWVEDLHRGEGSKRFWEEEQKRVNLRMCCSTLNRSLWEVRPTYRLPQWHDSRSSFHLPAFEATFIKTSNPALRRQKNSCTAIKIAH